MGTARIEAHLMDQVLTPAMRRAEKVVRWLAWVSHVLCGCHVMSGLTSTPEYQITLFVLHTAGPGSVLDLGLAASSGGRRGHRSSVGDRATAQSTIGDGVGSKALTTRRSLSFNNGSASMAQRGLEQDEAHGSPGSSKHASEDAESSTSTTRGKSEDSFTAYAAWPPGLLVLHIGPMMDRAGVKCIPLVVLPPCRGLNKAMEGLRGSGPLVSVWLEVLHQGRSQPSQALQGAIQDLEGVAGSVDDARPDGANGRGLAFLSRLGFGRWRSTRMCWPCM